MGLAIMVERARSAGLTLSTNSRPGAGTEVRIEWRAE
jgi:nitrate/nitrite-specific signal transduction histidine kinase